MVVDFVFDENGYVFHLGLIRPWIKRIVRRRGDAKTRRLVVMEHCGVVGICGDGASIAGTFRIADHLEKREVSWCVIDQP